MLSGGKEPIRSLKFSLAPLLKELHAYIENFNAMTWSQRDMCWRTKVGSAQFLLPAIYLQHYCNRWVKFNPTPAFTSQRLKEALEFIIIV